MTHILRQFTFSLLLTLPCFLPSVSNAQITPQPSPGATLSQTIGVTEIYMEYSRPGVKGRRVFGELVPFQRIWRTGANASTKLEVSNPLKINGVEVAAGVYALMSRPGISEWELYLYNELDITEETAVNFVPAFIIKAKPTIVPFTETMLFFVSDISDNQAFLHFRWETTELILQIDVDNIVPVMEAIAFKNDEMAGNFQQAAEYLLQKKENLPDALNYINKSIMLKETFRNVWIKSQILNQLGQTNEALSFAIRAKELGTNDPIYNFFSDSVNSMILQLSN